jgi:hypothetical protein
MTGLTQEEQKRNNPFTLEAILEEESDVNDSYINDALPFDKCLKADTQVEEVERKKELSRQLGTARTTADQSKKEIREWLGTSVIIKTILKLDFLELIGIAISVGGTVGLWNLWLNTLNNTDYFPILLLRGICLTIFIGALMTIGVYSLFSIATTKYNFITTKMNEKDYLIKEDIVDCPIAVKEMLLSHIEADELYGKVNKERKRFEWLKDDGECDHYWNFDKPKDKNDIEYQMKYLADQLEAGKVYKLTDIITDKVKKKVGE